MAVSFLAAAVPRRVERSAEVATFRRNASPSAISCIFRIRERWHTPVVGFFPTEPGGTRFALSNADGMTTMSRRKLTLVCGGIVWVLVVAFGLTALWSYSLAAGEPGHPPRDWPATALIKRLPNRPTVVIAVHPRCPCSRATIGELSTLMARADGRISAFVLFAKPAEMSDDWVKGDLWTKAVAIPGVTVLQDDGGLESTRFGALTSGQTLLYDASGRLRFSGGITKARGHHGDNDGLAAVTALATGASAGRAESPVFGCALFGHPA